MNLIKTTVIFVLKKHKNSLKEWRYKINKIIRIDYIKLQIKIGHLQNKMIFHKDYPKDHHINNLQNKMIFHKDYHKDHHIDYHK